MTSTPPPAGPTNGPDAPAPGSPWPTDRPAPMGTGPRVTADQVRDLSRLRRITVDRKIGGVAGGIARHLDIDPLVVRVAFVVLTLFGGAGLVMYAAGWLLLPEDGEQRQPLGLDDRSRSVALILAGILGICLLVGQWDWFWVPGPLILVALVVWLVMSKRNENQTAREQAAAPSAAPPGAGPNAVTPDQRWGSTPVAPAYERAESTQDAPAYAPYQASYQAPHEQSYHEPPAPPQATRYVTPAPRNPRKRGPKLFWFTMALAALAVGIVGIVDVAGAPVAGSTYSAVVLGVVGVMLVIGSFFGRAGGLILVGLLAAAATGIGLAAEKWDTENVTIAPTSLGAGRGQLLLRRRRVRARPDPAQRPRGARRQDHRDVAGRRRAGRGRAEAHGRDRDGQRRRPRRDDALRRRPRRHRDLRHRQLRRRHGRPPPDPRPPARRRPHRRPHR